MMAAGARLPPLQLPAREASSPPQLCDSRRSTTFRALARDLDRAVATATSESPLRHPPWSSDERAMTLFRDWDVDEAAKQVRPPRRLHAIVSAASPATARDQDDLPPIEATRTATGMIILHEARPEVLAQRRELARRVAAAAAAATALAAATAKRERESAEAAKRERVYTISREELIQKHGPGHGAASGSSPTTSPRAGGGGGGGGGTGNGGGTSARSVLRFKYQFVPPPWEPFPGHKKPKPRKDARIAAAAGVRETSKIRMPVAPSHLRYIENLEDTVAELATEVAARRTFLMQRIDRFLAPGWRPFEGGAGSGSGAASAALGGLSGGGGKRSLADAIGATLHADGGDDGDDDLDDDDDDGGNADGDDAV